MPEISIIMPNYNCAHFIGEAIKSVLVQTYHDWELIICDDCSTDDSVKIITEYTIGEPRISLICNKYNIGVAQARNEAILQSKGDYVAFLDSDDIWYPHKLEYQIEFMRKHEVGICYMAYDIINEAGLKIDSVQPPLMITYNSMLKGERIQTATAIVKRQLLPTPPFPIISTHEDFMMWLNILKQGYIAHGIPIPLSGYRLRQRSLFLQ